ncbi:NAD-dependent epimerase/dehydratase family protein [bacterium]|nr:NAD-dependent epimerase/dehydratase family protein [bacterium]
MHPADFDLRESRVTVLGGSGFVGRYVVRALAKAGALVHVICRDPQGALEIKTAGYVGQIVLDHGDITSDASVAKALEYSDAVVNLVGILHESGRQRFAGVQAQGAERVAQAAAKAGVKRLVHVSALGVDNVPSSAYARTKLAGERAVLAAYPKATILRPSVIFGPEDGFFNRFAGLSALLPVMPLIGGKSLMQPVYVGDVAGAVVASLTRLDTDGKVYELGGPAAHSFKDILSWVMEQTGHKRPFLPIPFPVAAVMGAFAELLPKPALTRDQVKLLKADNVLTGRHPGLAELGIEPNAFETIVPEYLERYRKGGYYSRFKAA